MNNIGAYAYDIGYMDALATRESPIHRLDPRAKVITTTLFIVAVVSFNKYALAALIPFFLFPVTLIAAGSLPPRYLLRKVCIVLPFAVLVGIANPIIDRQALFSFGPFAISGGWVSFGSLLVRFFLTVTAALVLIATTGFNAVCDALVSFGVPRPFVVQLAFFYRYLFVLTDEAERMVRARALRAIDRRAIPLGTFASLISHLLLRTLDRAERIYRAMRCRGFDGTMRVLRTGRFDARAGWFVAGWALLFTIFRCYNIPVIVGECVRGIIP